MHFGTSWLVVVVAVDDDDAMAAACPVMMGLQLDGCPPCLFSPLLLFLLFSFLLGRCFDFRPAGNDEG
jgi:hypothetical protein